VVAQTAYVPARADLVWLRFDPQAGSEQAGRRPALVMSGQSYNRRTGLALFCPVTNKIKGYPFEVAIPAGLPVTGVILSDQVRCLDWRVRRAELIAPAPPEVLAQVHQRLDELMERV
jgi:mRNA interferase MazF